jgi:selenocysteine lyase/cysteine desulfurase
MARMRYSAPRSMSRRTGSLARAGHCPCADNPSGISRRSCHAARIPSNERPAAVIWRRFDLLDALWQDRLLAETPTRQRSRRKIGLLSLQAAQKEFEPTGVYLNTASIGLPPRRAVEALNEAVETWRTGRAEAAGYDELVNRARQRFASLVGTTSERVAIGNQVSTFTALVATALSDGARVLVAEEDFASVLFPFFAHADRGIRVQAVPLAGLVDAIGPGVDLVAVSAVQSADGRLVPGGLEALASAAAHHGCLTYVDATQAVGWLPFRADRFDFVSCAAYKWLLSPRGTAFGVIRPERLSMLRPLYAGWYAGDDPWTSIYGPPFRLAKDARRLDISPAWLSWAGTVPALDLLAEVGIAAIYGHDLALANALRGRLGLPPGDSAIVTVAAEGELERLRAAGIKASVRAGAVRLSFHLHNSEADVDAVARALGC